MCPKTRQHLRTAKAVYVLIVLATMIILVFRLVASLGKYAFRIQNTYLFTDCIV